MWLRLGRAMFAASVHEKLRFVQEAYFESFALLRNLTLFYFMDFIS
jgi:hypothetical protein